MRPKDIERIADSVVGAFGKPTRASAGCGDVSSTDLFECVDFGCGFAGAYECGGAGDFICFAFTCELVGGFECATAFTCEAMVQFNVL